MFLGLHSTYVVDSHLFSLGQCLGPSHQFVYTSDLFTKQSVMHVLPSHTTPERLDLEAFIRILDICIGRDEPLDIAF